MPGAEWQRVPPLKRLLCGRVPNLSICKQVTGREVDFVLLPFVFHLTIFVFLCFTWFWAKKQAIPLGSFQRTMKSILGFWDKTAYLLFSLMGKPAKQRGGEGVSYTQFGGGQEYPQGWLLQQTTTERAHISLSESPKWTWSQSLMDNHSSGLLFFSPALGPVPRVAVT